MTTRPLLNRNLVLWLVGSAGSQLGSALGAIALSFLVLHQTGRAGAMALTLACALGPTLLMPLAGVWVDRLPLKLPLIGSDLLRGLLQLGVAALALSGTVPLWLINGAALLGGLVSIFASPASSAAFPQLVPPAQLARANGLHGSVTQGAWLLGTLGGGVLVSVLGPALALLLDGLSFLLMAGLVALVRLAPRPAVSGYPSLIADLTSGLRLMGRSRILTFVPLIGLLVNAAVAPIMVLTPKLMQTLGPGAAGYGSFLALESLGGVLGGGLLAGLGTRLPARPTTLAGLLLLALSFTALGQLTGSAAGLWLCAPLLGAAMSLVNIPLTTLMQAITPPAYLGRVFSVLGTVSTLAMPLALLLLSPLLDRYPAGLFYGVAGLGMGLGALLWALVARAEPADPRLGPDLEQRPTL